MANQSIVNPLVPAVITATLFLTFPSYAGVGSWFGFFNTSSNQQTSSSDWDDLSQQQKQAILKRYQELKALEDNQRSSLQQRMDWFSQLSSSEQQQLRLVWQSMDVADRQQLKSRLANATPQEKQRLRDEVLAKYDKYAKE